MAVAPPVVLIVEDSNMSRVVTYAVLRAAGYRALCASTMAEAEALLTEQIQPIQLCLLDMVMPDGVGLANWRLLRRVSCDVPIIVLTGDADYAAQMTEHAQVLLKPVTTQLLLSAVQAVFSQIIPPPASL